MQNNSQVLDQEDPPQEGTEAASIMELANSDEQSTHPYNGLHPRNQQADPSRTKPPYWPAQYASLGPLLADDH
jgi:hypothetical protein